MYLGIGPVLSIYCSVYLSKKELKSVSRFGENLPLRMEGQELGEKMKEHYVSVPLCLFWFMWKAHNRSIFDNEELLNQKY